MNLVDYYNYFAITGKYYDFYYFAIIDNFGKTVFHSEYYDSKTEATKQMKKRLKLFR